MCTNVDDKVDFYLNSYMEIPVVKRKKETNQKSQPVTTVSPIIPKANIPSGVLVQHTRVRTLLGSSGIG